MWWSGGFPSSVGTGRVHAALGRWCRVVVVAWRVPPARRARDRSALGPVGAAAAVLRCQLTTAGTATGSLLRGVEQGELLVGVGFGLGGGPLDGGGQARRRVRQGRRALPVTLDPCPQCRQHLAPSASSKGLGPFALVLGAFGVGAAAGSAPPAVAGGGAVGAVVGDGTGHQRLR